MGESADNFGRVLDALHDVEYRLDSILTGKKLYLDPDNPLDALWIKQIHAFYPDDYDRAYERNLDSKPHMYYITPQDTERGMGPVLREADTSVHPLHTNLFRAGEAFVRGCSYSSIHNVAVAGADPHFRSTRHFMGLMERSENLYLHERGDVVSLAQTVMALRRVLEGRETGQRAIFIDNSTERFEPFLEMIGLHYAEGVNWLNHELSKRGMDARLNVNEVPKSGIARVKALGYDTERRLPALRPLYGHMFFETSSEEKEDDIRNTLHRQRFDLEVRHANELLGHSEHAPEWKWSFGGNALDKLKTTLRDKLADPSLDENLAKMGLTRQTAFIMVADGGESLADERIRNTKTMLPVQHLTHPYAEFPGSETKPVAQRQGSKEDGYGKLRRAYSELGGFPDLRLTENCLILVAPLAQDDLSNPIYYAFKNKAKMELVFDPRPHYHPHKTQRHFQKPEGFSKTVAELAEDDDKWMTEGLAIAGALNLMARAGHVPTQPFDLKKSFDAIRNMEVVSAWPLPEDSPLPEQFAEEDLKVKPLRKPVSSFDEVRRVMRNGKAFLFADGPLGKGENFWMSRVFLPSSIYVAKQLRDPHVNGNPMVLFGKNPEDRPDVEQIFDHLKRAAMVTQDPHYLYNRAHKIDSAARFIKRQTVQHLAQSEFESNPYKPLLPSRHPMVTFLLSASSANPYDNDDAYTAAVNWGLNGYGLMSGMGEQNPMGWHVFGGLQLIREGFDVTVQGVQDPFAMKTEGWPIKEMRTYMGDGHAVVAPDIFVRIEQLLELDKLARDPDQIKIVVAQANGIGGLQEIAGVLALREAGVPGMENVHMIIQNRPRPTLDGLIAPHAALMDVLRVRGDTDQIYECETIEEMMAIGSRITGRSLLFYDVPRPQDTQFPFVAEKHDYYNWFMHDDRDYEPPEVTITDAYRRGGVVPLANKHEKAGPDPVVG